MTEFSQLESNQLAEPETSAKAVGGEKLEAAHNDWLFVFLIALAAVLLIAASAVGLFLVLRNVLPGIDLQILDQQLPATIGYLPYDLQFGHLLLAGLLFLSFALYLAARWRLMHNRSLWPFAGCPSCHEKILLRVHRRRRDRMLSWIGLSVARYQCRNCRWNGLRIHRGLNLLGKSKEMLGASPTTFDLTPIAVNSMQGSGEMAPGGITVSNVNSKASSSDSTGIVESTPDAAEELTTVVEETTTNGQLAASARSEGYLSGENTARSTRLADGQDISGSAARAEITAPFGLNFREDPKSSGPLLDVLEPGTIVLILDKVTLKDGAVWQQIQVNDQRGWVLSSFLKSCE